MTVAVHPGPAGASPAGPNLLDAALDYARRGWPVLPCAPRGKVPITTHGLKDATTDVDVVRAWWERTPDANIGIATGPVGPTVVDVDGPIGKRSWMRHVSGHGWSTPWSTTSGGGWHVFYAGHPDVRNRAGWLEKVDVRGVGGFVVAPPSVGAYAEYRWEVSPDERPLAALPEFTRDALTRSSLVYAHIPKLKVARSVGNSYGQAALDGEIAKVRAAAPGTRNHTLCAAAFSLGQLVAAQRLDREHAVSALVSAGIAAGLGETETVRTVASGMRGGFEHPRRT